MMRWKAWKQSLIAALALWSAMFVFSASVLAQDSPDWLTKFPRREVHVSAWPGGKRFSGPGDFQNEDQWYPKPGDRPNKRYQLALYWRTSEKRATGPFELRMDDDEPIEVPKSKHNFDHLWE